MRGCSIREHSSFYYSVENFEGAIHIPCRKIYILSIQQSIAMEDKIKEYLKEWIINFFKNKDLILKKIESIKEKEQGFDVYIKFKDILNSKSSNSCESQIQKKEQFFTIEPLIEDINNTLSKLDDKRNFGLVVLNTNNNFEILVKNWKDFVNIKNLCVYFVNPFSRLDKKWIIYPHTHNNICEEGALEKGLKSIFDTVEPLSENQIRDRFK